MNIKFNAEDFRSKIQIKIRYDDLDTLGHVNNKVYLSYLEESRINYIKEVFGFDGKSLDFDVVVGRIDISYLSPVFLTDDVFVYTRVSRIGKKSYDFECHIVTKKSEIIRTAAYALVTMVSVDIKTGKTKQNNQKMVDAVLNFEPIKPDFSVKGA